MGKRIRLSEGTLCETRGQSCVDRVYMDRSLSLDRHLDRDMKTPNYTDLHRYPNGYVRAEHTDVAKTFARIRQDMLQRGIVQTRVRLKVVK